MATNLFLPTTTLHGGHALINHSRKLRRSETTPGSTQVARRDSTCSEVTRADKQNNVTPETYFSL